MSGEEGSTASEKWMLLSLSESEKAESLAVEIIGSSGRGVSYRKQKGKWSMGKRVRVGGRKG